MSFPIMEKQQMRTLRWILVAAVAVLVSCGGGSSSTQKDPVLDCNVNVVIIDPLTPTIWDAAWHCWGADRKVIVDIIIEMNPQMDPMNLKTNQTIVLPQGNSRNEFNITRRYKVGDTGPGGGIIVYVDEAGFGNSSGDDTFIGAVCLTVNCNYLEIARTDLEGEYSWDDAIMAAEAFSTSSADNWVLPSIEALDEMCLFAFGDTVNTFCNNSDPDGFLNSVGGFSDGWYWSSSEAGPNLGYGQLFKNTMSYTSDSDKWNTGFVRPVRAF